MCSFGVALSTCLRYMFLRRLNVYGSIDRGRNCGGGYRLCVKASLSVYIRIAASIKNTRSLKVSDELKCV